MQPIPPPKAQGVRCAGANIGGGRGGGGDRRRIDTHGGPSQGTGVGEMFGSNASLGQAALRGALSSSINQGVNIALGLQKSFSWREIAISGLSSAAATEASQRAGGTNSTNWEKFRANVSGSVSSALVRRSLGGRMESDAVLADVFGNAVGNSIVDRMHPLPQANGMGQTTIGPLTLGNAPLVNAVFVVSGSLGRADFDGLQFGDYSKKDKAVVVQIAVPPPVVTGTKQPNL